MPISIIFAAKYNKGRGWCYWNIGSERNEIDVNNLKGEARWVAGNENCISMDDNNYCVPQLREEASGFAFCLGFIAYSWK